MIDQSLVVAAITPEDAAHVLFVMSSRLPPAIQPGSFVTALIEAMVRADANNTRLLFGAYPGLMAAVWVYKNHEPGVETLIQIAEGGVA